MQKRDDWQELRYFLLALFLVFLTLKLTGHLAWSWWWITAPLWMPWIAVVVVVIVCMVAYRGMR